MLSDSFEDILLNHPLMRKFRRHKYYSGCGKCEHYLVCQGCPAVAYGDTGDMFSKPSFCFKDLIDTSMGVHIPQPLAAPADDCSAAEELDYILKTMKNQATLFKNHNFSFQEKVDLISKVFGRNDNNDEVVDLFRQYLDNLGYAKLK